jgi:hypothetical protein
MFKEKSFILFTQPQGSKRGLKVSSQMMRYDDKYTLTIGFRDDSHQESFQTSVTSFFNEDGLFLEKGFADQVLLLLSTLEKQQ